MQGGRAHDERLQHLQDALSAARLKRYMAASGSVLEDAVKLYRWNAELAAAFYEPLQMWEVLLRNRCDRFLRWKYRNWAYDRRFLGVLKGRDRKRLEEAIERQESKRQTKPAALDPITADLSAGFWVSLFTKRYEVPFGWRNNLRRVTPHTRTISRADWHSVCDRLLDLRNRIAHHEPIFHRPLTALANELDEAIAAMSDVAAEYVADADAIASLYQSPPVAVRT